MRVDMARMLKADRSKDPETGKFVKGSIVPASVERGVPNKHKLIRVYSGWGRRSQLVYRSDEELSHIFHAPLTAMQRSAARRLAAGEGELVVAKAIGIASEAVRFWNRRCPPFIDLVQSHAIEHEDAVREHLLAGEQKASQVLIEALDAENERGKPMWQTRVTAAIELLNRAGVRGKPVERQALVATHVSEGNTREALSRVLADPGVREWLKSAHPQAVAQIAAGVSAPESLESPRPDYEIEPIEEAS